MKSLRDVATAGVLLSFALTAPLAAQTPDRSSRPAVREAPDVELPPIQHFRMPNGLDVLLMEKRDIPLVQASLILDVGTVHDPAGADGVASMTAAMLDEGAAGRSALDIADAFEMLGARFGIGAGTHTTSMSVRTTTANMPAAMQLAADILLRPDFPAAELDRLRLERLTGLVRRYDEPNAIAAVLADGTLFGREHPYGRPAGGTAASLRTMSVDDLRTFYRAHYTPNNATLILVGDLTAQEAQRMLQPILGSWQAGPERPVTVEPAPQVQGRVVYLVDKPGAAQSVIRLGRIGVPRSTPDYYALEVMNTILGGSFTSRLNQNLREDKGYTYGAGSSFGYMPGTGPWTASAAVQTQSTGPALAEFMKELHGMHAPIPADEVERAKNFLAMRFPAGFQSVAGIAGRIGDMVQYALPADYFNRYVDNVLAVTKEDVERVARTYIDPANVAIFIVGDRQVIEQQIREQNLGEIRFLEVTDVLGPIPEIARE